MAKPLNLTPAFLSLMATSCRFSSGGHAHRFASSLPCGRTTPTPRTTSSSTRPAAQVSPDRSKQRDDEAASETTIRQQLQQVDVLENTGISRHFAGEIKCILDRTYRGHLNDTRTLLELHKASTVSISEDESILDSIGLRSSTLLREQMESSGALQNPPLFREVEHALYHPFYATLDRLTHRWNIENFNTTEHQMLDTPYLSSRYTSRDILALGIRDFNSSQLTYQQELQHLKSWVKECRLDQLPFVRQNLAYFLLSAAGCMYSPELSEARTLCAKNGALITVVDDFFDVGGSKEELENLVMLVELWDEHRKIEFYSEHVEIIFSSIYNSVNQYGAKASLLQDRNVTKHLVQIWLDLLKSMMTEVEWRLNKYVPTEEEYMTNASLTFALGPIVLPALYFVGPKIPESIVKDPEYDELFKLMSTCGRLLNDVQSFEREYKEGKLNIVSLLVLHGGSMSISDARRKLQKPIDTCRRDLLRLVLREESVVPRPCKELFWKMCKVCYFFYSRTDGFRSPVERAKEVNAVINEPLKLQENHTHMSVL
ncbi:kaurene synthase2 [Zea mays]|uniref:Kaurene synthase2 n=1 Tax=Zea mays TaxID=4577 RepID=A0A1D6DZW1_MAIZE|nr:kaurene synthase2 [Zea mays]